MSKAFWAPKQNPPDDIPPDFKMNAVTNGTDPNPKELLTCDDAAKNVN